MTQRAPSSIWHQIEILVKDVDHQEEIDNWCNKRFQNNSWTKWPPYNLLAKARITYGFLSEEHRMQFQLTWC